MGAAPPALKQSCFFNNATSGNDERTGPLFEDNQFIGFGIGSDRLTGGVRNDVFVMSVDTATDIINGGLGTDRIDYSSSNRGLTISLDNGTVTSRFPVRFQQTQFGPPCRSTRPKRSPH